MFLIIPFVLGCLSGRYVAIRLIVDHESQAGSKLLQPGMELDHFILVERLHSWPLPSQSAGNSATLKTVQSMPLGLLQRKSWEDLPKNVTKIIDSKYKVQSFLASGSFGEVWRATGRTGGYKGMTVALKLFYTINDGDITYHSYTDGGSRVRETMDEEERACEEVQELIDHAKQIDHSGQQYIIQCFESHLSKEPDQIGYLVQEYGGQELTWLGLEKRTAQVVLRDAREILVQLLSVLDLLEFRGLSHHDLKPANIVYQKKDGSILIKVVDWGALLNQTKVEARDPETPCHKWFRGFLEDFPDICEHIVHASCLRTPRYQPPEHLVFGGCYIANDIAKYDIYAAGLVYAVVLLLAGGGSPPMTQKDLKEELEGIQEIWTSNSNILATAVTEKMKSYAKEHGWYFRDEDRQLLERLTSKLPGNRPAAIDAIGSIGNLGHSLQNLVRTDLVHRLTSPPEGCRESSFGSAVQNTYTHRTYTFEKIDGTYDEVKLTILKNGKIKAEGAPFHLHQCILNTLLDTTRRKDYDWCCRSSYDYMSKTGPSLTGAKTATKMDVTFCVDSKTLDGARDLVINMMESGDNLKVNSNHVIQMTKFSQKHCSASP